jgi:hypothetical protein
VVGTTPGGELGGTWASPTVDATHSGSAHHTENHASRHSNGGADEVEAEDLATAETDTDLRLAPNGTGGVEWAAGGGSSGVDVEDEGTPLATTATTLDFVGAGVTATGAGATKTITIPGGGGGLTQAYVGYNTVGGSTEGMTANRVYAKKVTLANACLITDIEAYVDQSGFDDQVGEFHVALFSDSSGTPSRVLAVNAQGGVDYLLLDSASGAGGHNTPRWFGMGLGYWCTAGDYWLAVQVVSNSGLTIRYDGSGSDRYYTAGGFWIADWGWYAPTTSSNTYSIRANTIR